ncbi:MAG: hypothetical protein ACPLPT_09095 [Moorellales bacterium]
MNGGTSRRFFPGGNTAYGFYSFFAHLAGQGVDYRFILKGGPGVGKSTFMRRVAETVLEKGYAVEFFHCSSDPESLDGVSIPGLGVALLDGTAPHVVDPAVPGAGDEIVNLGEYWDRNRLRERRQAIEETNRKIKRWFDLAYGYLAHAGLYVQEIDGYYEVASELPAFRRLRRELAAEILGSGFGCGPDGARHLFASAVTPQGVVSHLPEALAEAKQVVVIQGGSKGLQNSLVEKVYVEALERGYYVEAFHCGLVPDYLEHLFLPELGVALVTSNAYHSFPARAPDRVLQLEEYLPKDGLELYRRDLLSAQEGLLAAIERAVEFIARAKAAHDALEEHYVPGMDWAGIDTLQEKITEQILSRAGVKPD